MQGNGHGRQQAGNAKMDNYADWLRDAFAMEQQSEKMLEGESRRLENYPQLKARIDQHIDETRHQQQLLAGCMDRLGVDPSTVKDVAAKFVGTGQAISGLFVGDEVVKGAMSSYVFESLEVASYTILAAAAKDLGDTETQEVCEQILREEIAMADWLKEHLPDVTTTFMTRAATPGVEARR